MLVAEEEKCVGCKLCELTCSVHHADVINPEKARLGVGGNYEEGFEISTCVRCGICKEECPEDAITETDSNFYQIDEEKCDNCLICVEVCPKDAVFVHEDFQAPKICDFCGECVEICPVKILEIEGVEDESA